MDTARHDEIALARIAPPAADRPSIHGMLLFGRDRLYLSHLPMARPPHNYQLVFQATLPDTVLRQYRADVAANDTSIYTVEPTGTLGAAEYHPEGHRLQRPPVPRSR